MKTALILSFLFLMASLPKDEDRQLIMQSLFSRVDTGLLKEDSSPTMPGVADKIFRN
ncbi:MAG: hypothetical protein HC905_29605 [Bacteroidales bacterium]|nr:hypothetical protein [Bacteroidales bacterium]